MARVKICGLSDAAGLDAALRAGADWVGFVFFPASPRSITPAHAAPLATRAAGGPGRVGLFVNPTEAEIATVLAQVPLDILQVYADAARAASLRARFGLPVWRALGVSDTTDLPASADGADALVVESKPPPGATRPGGNAHRFDWAVLRGWRAPCPWVLAGGLSPDNVAAAVAASGAAAVDVSSGVERTRGVKDAGLIQAFIEAARAA